MSPNEPAPVDVERLVEELRARVARMRAEGLYADDLSSCGLEGRIEVDARLARAWSTPVVGWLASLAKRALLRLLRQVLDDLAQQSDAAVERLRSRLEAEAEGRRELERRFETLARSESRAQETIARALDELSNRPVGLGSTARPGDRLHPPGESPHGSGS